MRIGVLLQLDKNIDEKFYELCEMGMESCQLVCWNHELLTEETAELVNKAASRYKVSVTAFWCGWPGPVSWDFYDGQLNLGLVPAAYRFERLNVLIKGSHFAKRIRVRDLITHVGFLPENPYDENYLGVIMALKKLGQVCRENGQRFLFETGQETPITLKRAIQDIGLDNIGINLDPANLLMYGKANPVDALDIFGEYVMGIHGKDGLYPTDGRRLGEERPLGEGRVDYPRLIGKLKEIGYGGDITIEREIGGDEQKKDILRAKALLEALL